MRNMGARKRPVEFVYFQVVIKRRTYLRGKGARAEVQRRVMVAKLGAAAICADSVALLQKIRHDTAERRRRLWLSKHGQ